MTAALRAFTRFLAGFFEIKAEQSMTRLVTLLCTIGALLLVRTIDALARRPRLTHEHIEMVQAVGVVLGVLVINGAVAIIARPRPPHAAAVPPPAPPQEGQ